MTDTEQAALDNDLAELVRETKVLAKRAKIDQREMVDVLGDVRDAVERLGRSMSDSQTSPVFRTTRALSGPPRASQAAREAKEEYEAAFKACLSQFEVVEPLADSFLAYRQKADELEHYVQSDPDVVRARLDADEESRIAVTNLYLEMDQAKNDLLAAADELDRRKERYDQASAHYRSVLKGARGNEQKDSNHGTR